MSVDGLTETTLRATGIGLMVATTPIVVARALLHAENRTRVRWHDGWLLLGYLFFMAVSGVYVAKTGVMFRLLSVQEGRLAPHPGLSEDSLDVQKTFFFTGLGLWVYALEHQVCASCILQEDDGQRIVIHEAVVGCYHLLCLGQYS